MTAAQNTIALKRSSWMGSLLAAAVVALIVAIIALAISARPVAAPATTAGISSAPTLNVTGADQFQSYMQSLTMKHNQAVAANHGPAHFRGHVGALELLKKLPPKPSYPDVTAPKHPRLGGPHRAQ